LRRLLPGIALVVVTLCATAVASAQEFLRVEGAERPVSDSITGLTLRVRTGPFLLARTELSQAEFERVMGRNPSWFRGSKLPVENLTWREALEYCNRRSEAEGLRACYRADGSWDRNCDGYRLPTEAEWMAAAGEGDTIASGRLNGANLYDGVTSVAAVRDRAAAGPRPVDAGRMDAGRMGFSDLAGNVWELCWDRFSAAPIVDAVRDPEGPQTGTARVLRGGSFLTQAKQWNKGFRSSQEADVRSPYVGVRLARSLPVPESTGRTDPEGIRAIQAGGPGLAPNADEIAARWMRVLGRPSGGSTELRAEWQQTFTEPAWTGRLLQLQVGEEPAWRALMVLPAHHRWERLPFVVIPYYDVDTPVGKNLGGRNALPAGVRAFAHLAAMYGMGALVVRWAGENHGPGYLEVVASMAERHPELSGLGYWVWQAQRVVDWLATQPEVDAGRIGMMGHSLGGKMALYAGAFEPRLRAVVSSEPGIALEFSNYGDPWYLGERVALLPQGADHHELLQLTAPRPFLLIAGESADGEKSVPLLERAAGAYAARGGARLLVFLNHRSGHSPTPESVVAAMEWLQARLSDAR
jgi:predicted esterase